MERIKPFFDTYCQLSFSTFKELKSILIEKSHKKGKIICGEGEVYKNEVLVVKGLVRGFYNTYDNDEVNVSFFSDGDFFTPWFYRNINGLSNINYQALEMTELIEFNAEYFSLIMDNFPDLQKFGMTIVERELKDKTNREINLLSKDARERYDYFQKRYPGLENRLAQYHIASYLGITPISLSRLRGGK